MSTKGSIATAILFGAFIAFAVGVPSYQMIYQSPGTASTTNTQPSFSYMGACDDTTQYNSHCASLTADFWHCMNGDKNILTYNYNKLFWGFDPSTSQEASSNRLDETLCARMMTCQAFGLMAIILAFFSVAGALLHSKWSRSSVITGGVSGIFASFFGSIALAIFFSSRPEMFNNLNGVLQAHDSDLSGFLTDGTFKLGYSTGLQIAGIIASFIGGCVAVAVDFSPEADAEGLPMAMPSNMAAKQKGSINISGTATPNTDNTGHSSAVELGAGHPTAAAAAAPGGNNPGGPSEQVVQWH